MPCTSPSFLYATWLGGGRRSQAFLGSPWGAPKVHNPWPQVATAALPWLPCYRKSPVSFLLPLPCRWFHTSRMSARPVWPLLGGSRGLLWDFWAKGVSLSTS